MYGAGKKPSTEPMLMMRPLPWCRMWGTTARVIRTSPKKFVSKIDRACAIELSSAPAGAAETGVVHEQVDAALQANHFPDGSFHGFIAGHVEGQHLERSLACLGSSSARAINLVASHCEPLPCRLTDA